MRRRSVPGTSFDPVPLSTVLLYNGAGFTFNLYDTVLYAWLAFFYAPPSDSGRTAFVSLGLFGALLAAGRILDAVSDPLVGYWSDRTNSRWGRRRPFIFISGPILFLAFVFVWRPPVAEISPWNAVYLGCILFLYYWSYTGFLIPWLANLPEITRDGDQRIRIVSIGIVIGIIGSLIGGGLSGPLLERNGLFVMALVLGGSAFVLGELSLFGIRENYTPPTRGEGHPGFVRTITVVFRDRQVLAFTGMIFFVQLTYQLMLMNVPYMTTLILGQDEAKASLLMGEVILLMAAAAPLWYVLLKNFPKRQIMRVIIVMMTLGFAGAFMVGTLKGIPKMLQAMLIMPLAAVPMGGMFAASLALIADLTDYGAWKDGGRNEAVYYGIYGVVRKTGWALCSLILSAVFGLFGYSSENPLGVRIIWLVCAACCLLGLLLFIPYRLGDSREETERIMNPGMIPEIRDLYFR